MGVYGDFLGFFSELLERQEFYSQEPQEAGGYGNKRVLGTFLVVYQDDTPKELTARGGKWHGLDVRDALLVWSAGEIPVGAFFKPAHKAGVYRVVGVLSYQREGGFSGYVGSRVTGATGEQMGKLELKRGIF
jgi:hypothetical protein